MAKSKKEVITAYTPEASYVAFGQDMEKGIAALNSAIGGYQTIHRSTGGFYQDLSDLATNVSGRPGLTRQDYSYFRPDEAIPTKQKEIISKADVIYRRVGLIRNIVDLMGDFACQGVRISHPNPRVEKFYRRWWAKVNGNERSERFLNLLYRLGNVIIKRRNMKMNPQDKIKYLKTVAQSDLVDDVHQVAIGENEIPARYVFYDPTVLEFYGGALSAYTGQKVLTFKLPENLRRIIRSPKTPEEKKLVADLPEEVKLASKKAGVGVPLPMDQIRVFHYKKDDWLEWAYPMIYAIMDDVILLEKLRLADIAALDGAISQIRIFKLGSLEHKIAPSRAAASKLAEILESHTGVGTIDLVWGPDIDLVESSTQVHQFLGEDKYKPTLNNIYAGLGIPPTLTGTFGAAGTTNNFISLKTLIQRLEYGRSILTEFWNFEAELIRQVMGFRLPAVLEFEHPNLEDERSEKALLIQLADRNLISDELLQLRFGHNPSMEKTRIMRENRDREREDYIPKAGPYFEAEFEKALKKIALQTGVVTPSQLGLDLPKPKKEELALIAQPTTSPANDPKPKGKTGQGRPQGAKDKQKRKQKTFTPKTKATLELWASGAQALVSECISKHYLEYKGKGNLRQLTDSEFDELERLKFNVLFNLQPFDQVNKGMILDALKEATSSEICKTYAAWLENVKGELGRQLSLDEKRQVQVILYTSLYGEDDEY